MCRYGMYGPYKEKYACFACRKTFKQTSRYELAHKMRTDGSGKRLVLCPECKGPMHDMGLDFHAPRQSDVKQWRKLALLHANGITFHSCGCGGPGYRPATLNEVSGFLAAEEADRREQERKRVKCLMMVRKLNLRAD